ncbi:MAG: serine--tRNA ligase, partial [Thermoplasmata archaeon]
MLDINLIRERPEVVRRDLEKRGDQEKLALLEELMTWDSEWRETNTRVNELRHRRNVLSKEVASAKAEGRDPADLMRESSEVGGQIESLEGHLESTRTSIDTVLRRLPNILDEDVPVGKDDSENVEIRHWGTPKEFDFDLKAHGELLETTGMGDFERARKIAGAGFLLMKGDLVLLD